MWKENSLTEYHESLPDTVKIKEWVGETEEIRIYKNCQKMRMIRIFRDCWRFVSLVAAFAAIFFILYIYFFEDEPLFDNGFDTASQETEMVITDTFYEQEDEREVSVSVTKELPRVIDESKSDINIEDYFIDASNSDIAFFADDKVKVLVVHTHTSERVAESLNVIDAGEAITQMLNSSGIRAVHSTVSHDKQGRIGAYNRMKATVEELKEKYTELVLIIDLHGSESSVPFQFDIGVSSEYAWKENLRIVAAVCNKMDRGDTTVRLLPQDLGQDNGIITLNVALGDADFDNESARELIADLSLGIIMLFTENTPV